MIPVPGDLSPDRTSRLVETNEEVPAPRPSMTHDERRHGDETFMAEFDGNSLLRYMVDDPETFAQNLAKALEQAGKAAAAYLKPRETGETPIDMSADIANVTKTLAHVGEYWLADPARTIAAQNKLVGGWMDLWSSTLKRMSGEPVAPVAEPDPKDKRFADPEWTWAGVRPSSGATARTVSTRSTIFLLAGSTVESVTQVVAMRP
jgi:hypothetical protein